MNEHEVFKELESLPTEDLNPATANLDLMTPLEIVTAMNREDKSVAFTVEKALPQIAEAAKMAAESFAEGGRLIYVGAGTSGRLGVLDASECPPTFGVPREQVVGIIAGGYEALRRSIEGAEDDENAARAEIERLRVSEDDTVCGVTASRRTPFVKAALDEAKLRGARTVFVCCNPPSWEAEADAVIAASTGPEILAGSTRLKAGTATKMILNMISTAAMILSGKTYRNFMVGLMPWSDKLRARSRLVLSMALDMDYGEADKLLEEAQGNLKAAIVMRIYELNYEEALKLLEANKGRVRNKNTEY
ncbi:MAG: N-acetylmuramic acid 6-phosphate etherase [candidate division Zixibacteria bacterium]|nr:N-acetylmuramic acid 6-phosphate etherase [Candidatus Tariuqbacter arcticus]